MIQTFDDSNQPTGQGSGFFINNKGHIVTNYHVIEGAFRATVKTSSGIEYPVEGIIAKNADADIVKLVVNIADANLPFLNLSETIPSEGQDIVVIGNPLGLESTVSSGIVSAVRDIPAFGKILQITAPISPGSSGSPVINTKGEVIGIATLIVTKGQNLNFAIPTDKIITLKEISQITLSNAIPPDINDAQIFYQKGMKELWQENWSAALTYFQKAKEKKPQDADVLFQVGYCFGKLSINEDAIESFKQAIRISPDYAEAHYNLGITYNELGDYENAIESYKQVIRIKSDFTDAHSCLGVAYSALGRYQDAIESFKKAIIIKSDDAVAYYNLGVANGELGRHQDAVESYKQAIIINPDFSLAHVNLGVSYSRLARYQDAIESYKQAIIKNPNYDNAHCGLGSAYGQLGRYKDAIESFKQAIRINPNNALAHYGLGGVYYLVGDKDLALEEYKILKTLDVKRANELFNLIYQ
ncbi:MAG: tetratricopeptide repeat protein [Sedimentisphaerales bacterium]|nr:tetratricopeptide repeat protein [Sedimentisphaerales bacterium]